MGKEMLREKIKKMVLKIVYCTALFAMVFIPIGTVKANSYVSADVGKKIEQRIESKGKVLIYNTHTSEDYVDTNVVEMAKDLKGKLEKMGYEVTYINKKFDTDYPKAYYKSREALQEILGKESFDMIIDYHRNSLPSKNTVNVDGKDVARLMTVIPKQSINAKEMYKVDKLLSSKINEVGSNVVMKTYDEYNKGINYYNSDLSDKLILVEMGNQNNNKWEIMRLNTYFAQGINNVVTYSKNIVDVCAR